MNASGTSFLSFLVGISVGIGITIFLQTEKGKEIRQIVSDFLEEKGIQLNKEQFNKLVEEISNRFCKKGEKKQVDEIEGGEDDSF